MGMHGWRLQLRLSQMIGPALEKAIGAMPKGKVTDMLSAEIDPSALGSGVVALFDAIASNDPRGEYVAELLSQTTRNGVLLSQGEINKVYAANYLEMMKAIFAVVAANGFFGLSGIGLDALPGLMAQASPARSTKA
jgi:hypothetical protein